MISTGLMGPYRLTVDGIESAIPRKAPGTFALGYTDHEGRFWINHVGRSDDDVGKRLRGYIGSELMFKFSHFASSRMAFEKECQLFHTLKPPGNFTHPDRPKGTNWECPYCRGQR